jgi:hypothetical protein
MTSVATQDVNDLRDTISAAVALGLPIPAPALTHAVEVVVHGWDYDDPDISLGLYQSREAATIALRNWVVERHEETEDQAPWAIGINAADALTYDAQYTKERSTWLTQTDEDIIASMFDDSMYFFTYHKVENTPERTV